jgi:hypothetical protein
MTTSLPTTSPENAFGDPASNAQPSSLLEAFAPSTASDDAAAAACPPDFAALLGASAVPAVTAALPTMETATSVSVVVLAPTAAPVVTCRGTPATTADAALVDSPAATSPAVASAEIAPAAGRDELPERSTLEAALALALPLLTAPGAAGAIEPAAIDEAATDTPVLPAAIDAIATSPDEAAESAEPPVENARTVRVTLQVPGRAPLEIELPLTADPLPLQEIAEALLAKAVPLPPRGAGVPSFASPAQPQTPSGALAAVSLPDGAQLTLAITPEAAAPTGSNRSAAWSSPFAPARDAAAVAVPAENSAAAAKAIPAEIFPRKSAAEKNFLTAGKQLLTPPAAEAGIAVAQTPLAMPAAPTASLAPAAAAASLVAFEAKPAANPAEAPSATSTAPQAIAQRAVDTVTSIVDAQAASRMQPAPSVQLRFKVGAEDLAVRVELRHGEVRTEFQTDSAELRSALAQEWRAVVARPEAGIRFLDPVITTTHAAGQGSSFSSSGQSSSHQQQAQQQFRAQAELFGSVGRSFAAAPSAPESAAPVAPLVPSPSQRLSAVA